MLELKNIENLVMIISEDELTSFLRLVMSKSADCPADIIPVQCGEKKNRTEFHQLIKKYLQSYLESTSVESDGQSQLKLIAKHKNKKGNKDKRQRSSNEWPAKVGNFLEFTILKENIDTMTAIQFLSRTLHIKDLSFGYAGTKDKRGVTAQRCTVYRAKPTDIARVNSFKGPFVRVGDFQYVSDPLRLGNLRGNRFEIILRNISVSDEEVHEACRQIKEFGFINYYGLQRFGKGGSRSHDIGRELYKANWKNAVNMLFQPSSYDFMDVVKAKEAYNEGDLAKALQLIPPKLFSEKAVLSSLVKSPNDYAQAFQSVPKNIRLICAHAYQSYLWNMGASERISLYGLECVEGDLVVTNGDSLLEADDVDLIESVDDSYKGVEESTQAAKKLHKEEGSDTLATSADIQQQKHAVNSNIHIVTKEDVKANRFSIRDVVLPTVGSSTIFPTNAVGEYFKKLMEADGISETTFSTCSGQYRTFGSYRRLFQYPYDFEWEILEYKDLNEDLAVTEISLFRPKDTLPTDEGSTKVSDSLVESKSDKTLRALSVKFTLSPGTYATMLLREILKESTETKYQTQRTIQSQSMEQNDINTSE